MKKAYGLIRVSTTEQETSSQRESLRKIAKDLGYTISDEDFFEEKITGYDEDINKDRRSISQLKERIRISKPDAIFIWELSRLTRRAIKVAPYINELSIAPGIPMYFADFNIWTIEDGEVNDEGILTLQGASKGVEIERDRIRARTTRGRTAKAEKGLYVGHLKDGYTWKELNGEKKIILDEERVDIIKRIFSQYLEGKPATEIRDYLNAKGIPPTDKYRYQHPEIFKGYKQYYKDRSGNVLNREDALWTDSGVCVILRDEWYKGIRKYNGKAYTVPEVVTEDEWQEVQDRLAKYRWDKTTAKHPYLLTGMVFCGTCGRKMYAYNGGDNNYYYCSSKEYGKKEYCGARTLRQENIDSIVYNVIRNRAFNDMTWGATTVFSKFFKTDQKAIKDIADQIDAFENGIIGANEKIEKEKKDISLLLEQELMYIGSKETMDVIQEKIKQKQQKIEDVKNDIKRYSFHIKKLKRQKKQTNNVQQKLDKLDKLDNLEDFNDIKDFINTALDKVIIYNAGKKASVIKIIYKNAEKDLVIYDPARLKKRFIFLSEQYQHHSHISFNQDTQELEFPNYYLIISNKEILMSNTMNEDELCGEDYEIRKNISFEENSLVYPEWDTPLNRKRFYDQVDEYCHEKNLGEKDKEILRERYDWFVTNGIICTSIEQCLNKYVQDGYKVFKDSVSVNDYIECKRKGTLNIYEFSDLLPLDERAKRKIERKKEYDQIHYKKGTTFTSFIVKNATYAEIEKKRKHLYNRRYKIKNHKSMGLEQKELELTEIDQQLEALKFQVEYLPTNQKGKNNIAKYNKEKP